jgi:hypothetical protein
MTYWEIISQFILPPLLGGAGGVIAVWASWGVEKRRAKLQRRQQLVDRWRNEIIGIFSPINERYVVEIGVPHAFLGTPAYASLLPHLSKEAASKLHDERTIYIGGDHPRRLLMKEIGRIEQEWGLV